MDCPRCGFTQPRDQFCAQCGLNVEAALKIRPPWWQRLFASSRLYVALVALLFGAVVAFFLGVNVPRLLGASSGDYVASRDAGISSGSAVPTEPAPEPVSPRTLPVATVRAEAEPTAAAPARVEAASLARVHKRFEIEFWEIGHDQVATLIDGGERVAAGTAGRAFVVHGGDKLRAALKTNARPVGAPHAEDLRVNAQAIVETPPGIGDGLHFGLAVQLVNWDDGRANLRLNASLSLTPPESPAERASLIHAPAVESAMTGAFELTGADALIMIIEPTNRHPAAALLGKAGAGPWQIFGSPNFAVGETEWIATIRLK